MSHLLSTLAASAYLRGCNQIGKQPLLRGRPYIENFGRLEIGNGFQLDSRPVQSHLVTGPGGHLQIGDDVRIAFGAAVACHGRISIGDGVSLGSYAMLMDTDFHDLVHRDQAPEAGEISIGDDVRIGNRVTILRNTVIGSGATIAAGSVVSGEVPAGSHLAGVPARVVDARSYLVLAAAAEGAAPPEQAAGSEAIQSRVQGVVARTFALQASPELSAGPHNIMKWDSLGALTLMLNLEEEFGVSLTEDDVVSMRSVQSACSVISQRLGARR